MFFLLLLFQFLCLNLKNIWQLFWYELEIQFSHVATLFSQYHIFKCRDFWKLLAILLFSIDLSYTMELNLNCWPCEIHFLSIHETVTEHKLCCPLLRINHCIKKALTLIFNCLHSGRFITWVSECVCVWTSCFLIYISSF